jgi:hypothetical protein
VLQWSTPCFASPKLMAQHNTPAGHSLVTWKHPVPPCTDAVWSPGCHTRGSVDNHQNEVVSIRLEYVLC